MEIPILYEDNHLLAIRFFFLCLRLPSYVLLAAATQLDPLAQSGGSSNASQCFQIRPAIAIVAESRNLPRSKIRASASNHTAAAWTMAWPRAARCPFHELAKETQRRE